MDVPWGGRWRQPEREEIGREESGVRIVEPTGGRLFEDGLTNAGKLVVQILEEGGEVLGVGVEGIVFHGCGGILERIGAEITGDPFDTVGGFLNLGAIVLGKGLLEFL